MAPNTLLVSSLNTIRQQAKLMKENLAEGHLLQALKNCSNFLNELRSSAFSPKEYYELYMAVFDALEDFSAYLLQSAKSKQAKNKDTPFLTDLYELVQYSGNIVPRLYMMIVVGTTCMAVNNVSSKDIMKDMIEMCRGVQHPIRGLFLRHYLGQRCKELFPMATRDEFNETVDFLVTNFVEMNKLWVRLQHQGHSSERMLRYQERKELKILVGSNLVRLSQVVDDYSGPDYSAATYYEEKLFPTITEQIIQCKDHLAQSYLVDVLIQVFPDSYHLLTLEKLLNDVFLNLHPMLKKSDLVASLVDRFVTFKSNEDELAKETSKLNVSATLDGKESPSTEQMFSSFWTFYSRLKNSEPPLASEELIPILQSLVKLSSAFDPSNYSSLDKVYQFAAENYLAPEESNAENALAQQTLWADLLVAPIGPSTSVINLLKLPYFYELYSKISDTALQKVLSYNIIDKLLAAGVEKDNIVKLRTTEEIDEVFKYLLVLIKDSNTSLNTSKDLGVEKTIKIDGGEKLVTEKFLRTQEIVSKTLHSLDNEDEFKLLSNLLYVKKKYLNKSPENIIFTYPTIITRMTNVLRIAGYKKLNKKSKTDTDQSDLMISSSFKNISVVIDELYQYHQRFGAELVLKCYLNLATVADQLRLENIAYELFSQCFVVYEESLSLSGSQAQVNPHDSMGGALPYQSVVMIANRLSNSRFFKRDNYESLITKLTLYGSKLLKKQDQCRSIYFCAHLWWWCEALIDGKSPTVADDQEKKNKGKTGETEGEDGEGEAKDASGNADDKSNNDTDIPEATEQQLYQDPKRVLECLQKALRVADSCMDPYLSLKLFVEVLNRCLIFNIYDNWMIDSRYINGLIDLIRTNFSNFRENNVSSDDDDQEARLLRRIDDFFERTLTYLKNQQQAEGHFQGIVV